MIAPTASQASAASAPASTASSAPPHGDGPGSTPPTNGVPDAAAALAAAVAAAADRYEDDRNVPALHRALAAAADTAAARFAARPVADPAEPPAAIAGAALAAAALGRPSTQLPTTLADALVAAAHPYEQLPEIAGPLYERVVALRPDDARALVVLANAYWLHGRGPEVVGDLAARALAADPASRGAWHLWALTEPDPRQRMLRWQQVTVRFPTDDLARALFADSAASVAGAEHDDEALVLAVAAYEELLGRAERPEQRLALEEALDTLRRWKL